VSGRYFFKFYFIIFVFLLIQQQCDLQACANGEKEVFHGAPREGNSHSLSEDAALAKICF